MIRPEYKAQVDLLLSLLPHVATEKLLALKGGTAINLFVNNMPRLSVDIDLTYTRWQDERPLALQNISDALERIETQIRKVNSSVHVTHVPVGQGEDAKLNCQTAQATVKIEVNTVTRGLLFPDRLLSVTQAVQTEFKKFAAIKVVSHAELYGGKICAALDRQHPRDLFDIRYLLNNGGITSEVKMGFLLFLVSHARPIHELLRPNLQNQQQTFERQFSGMTTEPFTYADYEATREQLITSVNQAMTEADKNFLMGFTKGEPDWNLVPLPDLPSFPAVQWKLRNIVSLRNSKPAKYEALCAALEETLS
ncbi:MAG: nucleotidyl transferase AbiEii/AbiGii toxin family protein [Bacteroidetes bacterium]|jgi:predicted nucleotidyltransferase component of viral defense system|nr:nucleotidyl transferase AbiEii/AbiGii toxin family protein [Bacteroidota bacterium]